MNAFGGILGFTVALNNFSAVGDYVLTPPTLAPVLAVANLNALEFPNTANLAWSASNKNGSAGFGYRIYRDIDGGGFSELATTTALGYDDEIVGPAFETYAYYIEPYNDAGPATGGGLSNQAGVILPGEPNGPILLGPDGTQNSQYVYDDFTLTWSAVGGATLYNVYGSAVDSGYTLWQADVADISLAFSFAAAFGTNWFYIVAHDGAGHYSYQSNHLECTPVATTPITSRTLEDGSTRNCENSIARKLEA